ncbi:hypothetical protein EZ449_21000 [Pedobacter frigidisoli]|uniref:Uncharacterized protein n=1 Tax=Pedobacter frigidisoli TaxID=2530455 RepID=A0A4R0NMH3_9SPHI|nr:hypothetical protein [Pedobacter frigidisoli]TCD00275.1 hypothetical protein EZ449_21000 [Pedobacter frigidisoli]
MEQQFLFSAFNFFLKCISAIIKINNNQNPSKMKNKPNNTALAIVALVIIAFFALCIVALRS